MAELCMLIFGCMSMIGIIDLYLYVFRLSLEQILELPKPFHLKEGLGHSPWRMLSGAKSQCYISIGGR